MTCIQTDSCCWRFRSPNIGRGPATAPVQAAASARHPSTHGPPRARLSLSPRDQPTHLSFARAWRAWWRRRHCLAAPSHSHAKPRHATMSGASPAEPRGAARGRPNAHAVVVLCRAEGRAHASSALRLRCGPPSAHGLECTHPGTAPAPGTGTVVVPGVVCEAASYRMASGGVSSLPVIGMHCAAGERETQSA